MCVSIALTPNYAIAIVTAQKMNNSSVSFVENVELSEEKSYKFYSNLPKGKAYLFSEKISFVLFKESGIIDSIYNFKPPIKRYQSYRVDLEIENPENIIIYAEDKNEAIVRDFTNLGSNQSSVYKKIIYRNIITGAELILNSGETGISISIDEGFSFKISDESELVEEDNLIKIKTPAGDLTFLNKTLNRATTETKIVRTVGNNHYFSSNSRSIEWATYLGGSFTDESTGIAHDSNGNIYVSGYTLSLNFPATAGVLQENLNNQYDAFVTKFDTNGNLVWSTYYGGSDHEFAYGVKVNSNNKPVIAGYTGSNDLYVSTSGVFQSNSGGGYDGFILQLNSNGTFDWASYFGGSSGDPVLSMDIDYADNILIAGFTVSQNMPVTPGCFQSTLGGQKDAFVAKFNSTGSLIWSTYYGGIGVEDAHVVSTDVDGNVLLSGDTGSSDFPISTGCYQSFLAGGFDIYLVKFSPAGLRLWATYFGGTSNEDSYGLITDPNKNIYLTGNTSSNDFPLEGNSYQSTKNGIGSSYFAKFDLAGQLKWSTFYGGNGSETGLGLAIHQGKFLFSCGNTTSTNLPSIGNSFQPLNAGDIDVFLVLLDTLGDFHYSSYLGGSLDDMSLNLAVSQDSKVFLSGYTYSSDFPVSNGAYDESYAGDGDAFVTKIDAINWLPISVGKNEIYSDDFAFFPNPATEKIYFSGSNFFEKGKISAIIYDINGRAVIRKAFPAGLKIMEISVVELKKGFYITHLINEGNHLKTISFIKQ